ncbi:MAG: GerMN domain-containing protein [Actinomycetota bacterium]
MRRPVALLLGLLLALLLVLLPAACSNGLHVLPPDELPPDLYAVTPSPAGDPATAPVHIFLVREGRLARVQRMDAGTGESPLEAAIRLLLEGPQPQEVANGLATAIPSGVGMVRASVDGPLATLNLTGEFEIGAEQHLVALRLAQVVFTATGIPGVERVRFLIDGERVEVVGADGEVRAGTVVRGDYASLEPPPSPLPTASPASPAPSA